jgi:hypothetical protein
MPVHGIARIQCWPLLRSESGFPPTQGYGETSPKPSREGGPAGRTALRRRRRPLDAHADELD